MVEYKFGDFTTVIDNTDADFVEKFEQAGEAYNEEIKKVPVAGKESDKLRYIMKTVEKVFVKLFGEDAPKKMFGDSKSGQLRTDAFIKLVNTMRADRSATNNVNNALKAWGQNRQQRRYNAEHNKNHNKNGAHKK